MFIFLLSIAGIASEDAPDRDKPELRDGVKDLRERAISVKDDAVRAKGEIRKLKRNTEEIHKRAKELRERFKQASDKVKEQRDRVKDLREKAEKCKEDTEDCKGKRGEWRKGWLTKLERISDVLTKSLNRLSEKLEESDIEDKTEFETKISKLQEDLAAKKTEIAAMESPTAPEVAKEIKSMRDMWKEVQKTKKDIVGSLVNDQLEKSADKHEKFVTKLDDKVAEVEEAGKDSSKLKELLEDYKAQVANIKEDRDAAKVAWKDAENKKEAKDEWKKSWGEAREEMKLSKQTLREFMKEYKSLMGDDKDEVEDETEEDHSDVEDDDSEEETTEEE